MLGSIDPLTQFAVERVLKLLSEVSRLFSRLYRNVGAALERDTVRLPAQTVVAVLLAFGWMAGFGMADVTWGVFSALYVMRASVEGTVGEAVARVVGAFIGVALGVTLVLMTSNWALSPLVAIIVGVGVAAYLSARWPTLSYSLVTVTIFTVAPGEDILADAFHKSIAIVIGSVSGIAAAMTVLPLSAQRSMRFNCAASIELYGDLLVEWAAALSEGRKRPGINEAPAMQRAQWRAKDMAYQSRAFPIVYLKRNRSGPLFDRLEALWRTVPLMERVGRIDLTENICQRLGPALDRLAAAAKEQIDALARAVRERRSASLDCCTKDAFQQLNDVVADALRERLFDEREMQSVDLIRWAWRQVTLELDQLCADIGKSGPNERAA